MPYTDYILCVGRIEARKNQLSIIEAVKQVRKNLNRDIKLVFVGVKSELKHHTYIKYFEQEVLENSWIHYLGYIPYSQMPAIYKFAKVCVSASWFETTGLTSLEAIFLGTNAVAAGARAYEYLGTSVSYCDPGDVKSIADAICAEYLKPRPQVSSTMLNTYTWKNAALKTLEVYKELTHES